MDKPGTAGWRKSLRTPVAADDAFSESDARSAGAKDDDQQEGRKARRRRRRERKESAKREADDARPPSPAAAAGGACLVFSSTSPEFDDFHGANEPRDRPGEMSLHISSL